MGWGWGWGWGKDGVAMAREDAVGADDDNDARQETAGS